jgi:uncharacterized protein
MKIYLNDLRRISNRRDYPVSIDRMEIDDNIYLRRLEQVDGVISFYYDYENELHISYDLKGKMICPCAITLDDVEVPFALQDDENVVFDENEEGFYIKDSLEIENMVYYIVLPEVPIKVVKNEKIEYPRGDGWVFVSEEDLESAKKDEIDPRLQKLSEYRFEEDD